MHKKNLRNNDPNAISPPQLANALLGLEGVMPIYNDILVFGVGDTSAEALSNHDAQLCALFKGAVKRALSLIKTWLNYARKK